MGAYKPDVFGDCITIERKITKARAFLVSFLLRAKAQHKLCMTPDIASHPYYPG